MKKYIIYILIAIVLLVIIVLFLRTKGRPFPQNNKSKYDSTFVLPSIKQSARNNEVKKTYDTWKATYIRENPYNSEQWFLNWEPSAKGTSDEPISVTVSEAHGYAMVITAFMAGYDSDAQTIFDGMVRFYQAYPSVLESGLMAWEVFDDGSKLYNSPTDGDSATDGDMDIAYALLLADNQWGSKGEINYKEEAIRMINALADYCIHSKYGYLKLADWADNGDSGYDLGTRPSDFMFDHMRVFYKVTGDERWQKCIDMSYQCLEDTANTSTGLMPDFCIYNISTQKFTAAPANFLESDYDMHFNWNSCRVPWRLATDKALTGGNAIGTTILANLNAFIKSETDSKPGEIAAGYSVSDGSALSTYKGDNSYVAPIMLAAMANGDQAFTDTTWNYVTTIGPQAYFPDTISVMCLIVASGNWWIPE